MKQGHFEEVFAFVFRICPAKYSSVNDTFFSLDAYSCALSGSLNLWYENKVVSFHLIGYDTAKSLNCIIDTRINNFFRSNYKTSPSFILVEV